MHGWCPCEQQVSGRCRQRPIVGMDDGSGGGNRTNSAEFRGWERYHNQLLVAALMASAVAVTLVYLTGSMPGSVWTAVAISAGAAIGLLANYSKRYAEISAGKWRRGNVPPAGKHLRWGLVQLSLFIVSIVCMAWFVHEGGRVDTLGMIALGAALIYWASLVITVIWERRHSAVLIKEWGSWYAVNPSMADDSVIVETL
ncbi:hypothetical protein [Methanogenium cariaci]|uniref:hypothetical protein n=1 Tax=Methanogenium cariaci TaxID=2197 RepID=UPI0012F6BF4E|nr:hypothetical protein [Methanogenium cariaci]